MDDQKAVVEIFFQNLPNVLPLQPAAPAAGAGYNHLRPDAGGGQGQKFAARTFDQAEAGHFKGTGFHGKADQPMGQFVNPVAPSQDEFSELPG